MKKRLLALIVILAMVFTLSACKKTEPKEGDNSGESSSASSSSEQTSTSSTNSTFAEEDNAEFASFVDEQYKASIESSYLTMHVYYLDPEAAGLNMDNVEIKFGTADTPEKTAEDREYYNGLLEKLYSFDRDTLSRLQQDEYDSLEWEIKSVLTLEDEKFDYYAQLFAPPNSLDQDILSWMSAWELRSEREISELIQVIESLPEYVESAIEYAKVQQEKELFMTDFDTVVDSCDEIISMGMESETLQNLINQIDDIDGIADDKKKEYKEELHSAFENYYLPIFTEIRDAIDSMRDGYNNTEGYAAFPNGAEYFQALLNYKLGIIDVPVDELKEHMLELSDEHLNEFYTLMGSDKGQEILQAYLDEETVTGYTDYIELLEDIKVKMLVDHPEVKDLQYTVSNASEEEKLDEKNVAAYFLIPPVDGDLVQRMRVNPSSKDVGSLGSYTTITHEGFPGHMYQYAYIYEEIPSDYIKTLGVDGNVEGYAVYSQYGAPDYIDDEIISGAAKMHTVDDKVGYLIYSLVDIGINYEGWSMEDTKAYFDDNGYTLDDDTTKEVYDYLRCSPATYEPYGYGYEQIALLRAKAEEAMGDKFSAIEFNRALLNAGPTPYNVVTRHIDEYIQG